MCKIRCDIF